MATAKKAAKRMYVQFSLGPVVVTVTVMAETIEDAAAIGRDMSLAEIFADFEHIDGNPTVTGVYEL